MKPVVTVLAWTLTLLIVDQVWIQGAAKLHQDMVQKVQGSPLVVDLVAGAGFYALGAIAFYHFLLNNPVVTKSNVWYYGLVLGLCMFGTFDFTNKAIFKNYSWDYALKDTLWGGFVFSFVSTLIYYVKDAY